MIVEKCTMYIHCVHFNDYQAALSYQNCQTLFNARTNSHKAVNCFSKYLLKEFQFSFRFVLRHHWYIPSEMSGARRGYTPPIEKFRISANHYFDGQLTDHYNGLLILMHEH